MRFWGLVESREVSGMAGEGGRENEEVCVGFMGLVLGIMGLISGNTVFGGSDRYVRRLRELGVARAVLGGGLYTSSI